MRRVRFCLLLFCTCFALAALSPLCFAQHNQHLYSVTDLGTLGGTFSFGIDISDSGWVDGQANTTNDAATHAFLWRKGVMKDLGTLGGPTALTFYQSVNESGDVAGYSETSTQDPNNENECGDDYTCPAFFWWNAGNKMFKLPTLGGNNGYGTGINNWKVVAGGAENSVQDSTCPAGFFLEMKPVVWILGRVYEVPTYSGDVDGVAHGINDLGQVALWSGNCVHRMHALLWKNGAAIDLGNLGGDPNDPNFDINTYHINNEGHIVGYSSIAGDQLFHAFLWEKGVMSDLGTQSGGTFSLATSVNDKGQIVGGSLDASYNESAVIWQNGTITDLNTLIPFNSPLYLVEAEGINNLGQIVGLGVTSDGQAHAFLAVPGKWRMLHHNKSEQRPKFAVPDNVRRMLYGKRLFGELEAQARPN